MILRLYIPAYALTLLLSAFLLFSVQPMFSKMILPLLGGSPQVWNTAMLFFQISLLAGYAYAHFTSRYLSITFQAALHILLLIIFVGFLPFTIPASWPPPADSDPTLWQLSVMALTVGGPFFIVSGSAPIFQHWFGRSQHPDARNPYFLYGASNLGSMTALLAYPFLIEPLFDLGVQAQLWQTGYYILILLTFLSFSLIWNKQINPEIAQGSEIIPRITFRQRLYWIALAAIPSSLMLGVTTYITTDIASVPFLWVGPLALYVGTFILVFTRKPLFQSTHLSLVAKVSIIALIMYMIIFKDIKLPAAISISVHFSLFFIAALTCHKRLADARPNVKYLTEFYLLMSFGGVLGGFINAIIAPRFFEIPIEYALGLSMTILICAGNELKSKSSLAFINSCVFSAAAFIGLLGYYYASNDYSLYVFAGMTGLFLLCLLYSRWAFSLAVMALVMLSPLALQTSFAALKSTIYQERNFFGILRIVNTDNSRFLLHGTTNHGMQAVAPEFQQVPLSYFSSYSPLADAFYLIDQKTGVQKIGVIGLGVGVMSCYAHEGRNFDYYEIDKDVAAIAENVEFFTYLSACKSPYTITLGDGRLNLKKKPDALYDMFILDAFSSDNIPIHLLTRDAIQIYLSKIKPDGLIILHISNNYLDLEPVLARIIQDLNIPALANANLGGPIGDSGIEADPAHYVAISHNSEIMNALKEKGWSDLRPREGVDLWTDQYSNIFSVLGNYTVKERLMEKYKAAQVEKGETTSSP